MRTLTVVEWAEQRPGVQWDALLEEFGQDRDHWVQAFKRNGKSFLTETLDVNSAHTPKVKYAAAMIEALERTPELTWSQLEFLFKHTERQMRATLYGQGKGHLAKGRKR